MPKILNQYKTSPGVSEVDKFGIMCACLYVLFQRVAEVFLTSPHLSKYKKRLSEIYCGRNSSVETQIYQMTLQGFCKRGVGTQRGARLGP